MANFTVKLSVSGQDYTEIVKEAKIALSNFFDIPVEEVQKRLYYEIIASELEEFLNFDEENMYKATVVAKVKDV